MTRTGFETPQAWTLDVKLLLHCTKPVDEVISVCLLSSPQLGFFLHLLLRNPQM
jgi:hypothetical protein